MTSSKITPLRFYNSLYFKLSAVFLLSLVAFSLLEVRFGTIAFRSLVSEINQSLEWNVAGEIANQIQSELLEPVDSDRFENLIYPYSIANPKLEFYLLESDGSIFAHFVPTQVVAGTKIDMSPIRIALQDTLPNLPLYGENPVNNSKQLRGIFKDENSNRVFSVAPIRFNGGSGYLYVIIEGNPFEMRIRQIGQFFLARLFSVGGTLVLISTLALAYLLFRLLTHRFQRITRAVERYEKGDYSKPLVVSSRDEIGVLSSALNDMAQRLIEAKAEIEERDLKRRQLIALITHDLRAPLTSIQGYLDLALQDPNIDTSQSIRRDVRLAADNARFQARLIDDLFELSKLDAQEKDPSFDAFSLDALVGHVLAQFEPQAKQADVELLFESSGEKAYAIGDQVLVKRAINNLIENSLRFSPKGTAIRVSIHYAEQKALVLIADRGSGIASEKREELIELFGQDIVKENTTHDGAGLGLAIVSRVLELHGSSLRIESSDQKGSSFSFQLPLED